MKNGIFSRTLLALTLAAPALALTACGDSGGGKKATSTGTGSGTASKTSTNTNNTGKTGDTTGAKTGSKTGSQTGSKTGSQTGNKTATGTNNSNTATGTGTAPAPKNLLDTAKADANLTTFLELVKLAGLEADLKGTTAITIFAPTNAAFTALGDAAITKLKGDIPKLKETLKGHIIATAVKSTALKDGWAKQPSLATAKTDLLIEKTTAGVKVGPATVMTKDAVASNGVIHTINKVILAPAGKVVAVINAHPDLTKLKDALADTGVDTELDGQGPFTIFAPNDTAMGALSAPPKGDELRFLVGSLKKYSFEFKNNESITTLLDGKKGTMTLVESPKKAVKYGEGTVVVANIQATNGVIHIIDKVASVPTTP